VVPSTEGKGRLLSALPEHLRLLLDHSTDADASTAPHVHEPSDFDEMVEGKSRIEDDDDHSFSVHESFSISAHSVASSIHSDTLTVNKRGKKKKAQQVTTVPGEGGEDEEEDEVSRTYSFILSETIGALPLYCSDEERYHKIHLLPSVPTRMPDRSSLCILRRTSLTGSS